MDRRLFSLVKCGLIELWGFVGVMQPQRRIQLTREAAQAPERLPSQDSGTHIGYCCCFRCDTNEGDRSIVERSKLIIMKQLWNRERIYPNTLKFHLNMCCIETQLGYTFGPLGSEGIAGRKLVISVGVHLKAVLFEDIPFNWPIWSWNMVRMRASSIFCASTCVH